MFAFSAEEVVPRTKHTISAHKTMITIFFISTRLLVPNSLLEGAKFNHDYFIPPLFSGSYSEKTRTARGKGMPNFPVDRDRPYGQFNVS
jgi:hypothetical protein